MTRICQVNLVATSSKQDFRRLERVLTDAVEHHNATRVQIGDVADTWRCCSGHHLFCNYGSYSSAGFVGCKATETPSFKSTIPYLQTRVSDHSALFDIKGEGFYGTLRHSYRSCFPSILLHVAGQIPDCRTLYHSGVDTQLGLYDSTL